MMLKSGWDTPANGDLKKKSPNKAALALASLILTSRNGSVFWDSNVVK